MNPSPPLKLLVSLVLYKCLLPGSLILMLREISIELSVRRPINGTIHGGAIRVPLVCVVEPEGVTLLVSFSLFFFYLLDPLAPFQASRFRKRDQSYDLLVAVILVCQGCAMNDVCHGRLAYAVVHEPHDGSFVGHVTRVDECAGGGLGKSREGASCFLGGYKSTRHINDKAAVEALQAEAQGILCIRKIGCSS
jgi:hypothetical protein